MTHERWIMADISSLAGRIDAEITAVEERVKKSQAEQVEEHQARQKRLAQLAQTFDELAALWGPRLEFRVKRFVEGARATPRVRRTKQGPDRVVSSRLAGSTQRRQGPTRCRWEQGEVGPKSGRGDGPRATNECTWGCRHSVRHGHAT
jgi:hypothetical protein